MYERLLLTVGCKKQGIYSRILSHRMWVFSRERFTLCKLVRAKIFSIWASIF